MQSINQKYISAETFIYNFVSIVLRAAFPWNRSRY